MTFARFSTQFPVLRLRNEMDRLFGNAFDSLSAGEQSGLMRRGAFPAVNIWEREDSLYVEAELPGVKMDDIELSVLGDELTIKGSRPDESQASATLHRRERGTGAFNRVVRLPVEVDPEKVTAAMRQGVLTITLPKAPAVRPRRIEVKGS